MFDDGVRWCKKDESEHAYTPLPIYHKSASSRCVEDRLGVNLKQTLRRNRNRLNRDISNVRRTCSDDCEQLTSLRSSRLLNICLVIALHLLCNGFVTGANCDELYGSVGARGHFTHTWAVHIPGGEDVAERVARDHDMHLRGKVSHITANRKYETPQD